MITSTATNYSGIRFVSIRCHEVFQYGIWKFYVYFMNFNRDLSSQIPRPAAHQARIIIDLFQNHTLAFLQSGIYFVQICLNNCLVNLFETEWNKSLCGVKKYAFVKFRDASRRITVVRYVTDLGGEIWLAVKCVVRSCLSHLMRRKLYDLSKRMFFHQKCYLNRLFQHPLQ